MREKLEQAEEDIKTADVARQEVLSEIEKRKEVEAKWVKHYADLETENSKLKKEIEEYYSMDRAGYDFD